MTDKERLHRIWVTLEYLFVWWAYFDETERLEILEYALSDARNHAQIEELREQVVRRQVETGPVGEP